MWNDNSIYAKSDLTHGGQETSTSCIKFREYFYFAEMSENTF